MSVRVVYEKLGVLQAENVLVGVGFVDGLCYFVLEFASVCDLDLYVLVLIIANLEHRQLIFPPQ